LVTSLIAAGFKLQGQAGNEYSRHGFELHGQPRGPARQGIGSMDKLDSDPHCRHRAFRSISKRPLNMMHWKAPMQVVRVHCVFLAERTQVSINAFWMAVAPV